MSYIPRIPNPTAELLKLHGSPVTPGELVVPCVNINGTSKDDLVNQLQTAYMACETLMNALAAAAPHGRDYQTVSQELYLDARRQHDQRMRVVKQMQVELIDLAVAVNEQGRGR